MTRIDVELAVETDSDLPARCRTENVRRAVSDAVTGLITDDLDWRVRPWDLPGLRSGAAQLGEVNSAVVVHVDADVMAAELHPSGLRILLRGTDDGWRLARFAVGDEITLRPETTRTVPLTGWGPDAVLGALGIVKPDEVKLEYDEEYLGQGETRSVNRYRWTDGDRSVLAEQVKTEIYDGATPYRTYVRGVVVDGDRGTLLTGSDDTAIVIEG